MSGVVKYCVGIAVILAAVTIVYALNIVEISVRVAGVAQTSATETLRDGVLSVHGRNRIYHLSRMER